MARDGDTWGHPAKTSIYKLKEWLMCMGNHGVPMDLEAWQIACVGTGLVVVFSKEEVGGDTVFPSSITKERENEKDDDCKEGYPARP
jgi:hypothetical protein